ncbi:hypothetical protein GFM44_39395 [Rhizobium leguminosarum bv. viciae]|nr:hypothetical protein [Rhizobium leguminosarum bv. viciae]
MFLPTVRDARELHPKTLKDFLPGAALGAQVYGPRHEALMVWRNLQLIARVDEYRLEEFEVVNVNSEIRKQAQFPPPQTEAESVISQAGPKDQLNHHSANASAIQRNSDRLDDATS